MRTKAKALFICIGLPVIFSLAVAYGLPHIIHRIPLLNSIDLFVDEWRQNGVFYIKEWWLNR